jgi:4,5-DOPA dioxygenase extradiol
VNPMLPVIFVGHGSPMNAIEDNAYSRAWVKLGESLSPPKAILLISAHWETDLPKVTAMNSPKTIHDFYGFPERLYKME